MVGAGVEVVRARGEEGGGVVVGDGSSVGVSSGWDGVGPAVVAGGVPQIQVHTGASVVVSGVVGAGVGDGVVGIVTVTVVVGIVIGVVVGIIIGVVVTAAVAVVVDAGVVEVKR